MDFAAARHNMVECQIRPNQVTDQRLLDALSDIPREAFVPKSRQGVAYVDEAVAIADGRYVMEPMILGRLLQTAEVTADAVVLDIGCGTGYSAAVLSRLASTVVALECDPALAALATETLSGLDIDTVAVVEGPLEAGYANQGPYDVILFDGAVAAIPDVIRDQIADGGRLVGIVADGGVGKGTILANYAGVFSTRQVFDAGTPTLPGLAPAPAFQF
jgi:protein-L-isoaspartate(D-aspartate) O-methyltransferase